MAKLVAFAIKVAFIVSAFVLLFRPETFGFREDLFGDISPASLWESIKDIDLGKAWFWLFFASAIKLAGICAGIVRWRILLRAQGVHIPFWYLTKCWFWGRAIGLFLPGTLGLDGYRLVESSRYTGEVVKCTTVVAVEKLCGFIALFTLVFLTLPLGLRLFMASEDAQVNLALLAVVLVCLAAFITVSLTLLLQPRIIQVIVAVVPTPRRLRNTVDKLGAAVTAYAGHRASLFAALMFGLCVHLGICLMYVGTAMAISGDTVRLSDVLFASPLIIVGQVFAPTVSGVGVRELVMTVLLGGSEGAENAFLIGHLGLWFGEVVPFLLSLPLLLFTTSPKREDLMAEIEAVRAAARRGEEPLHLDPQVAKTYSGKVWGCVLGATLGGLAAGALLGLAESGWIWKTLPGLTEYGMFVWGPVVYGLLFAGVGFGVGAGLLYLYLLFDRFAPWAVSYTLGLLGALASGALVIGLWRYQRDVLGGLSGTPVEYARVAALLLGLAIVVSAAAYVKAHLFIRLARGRAFPLVGGGALAWVAMVAAGALLGTALPSAPEASGSTNAAEPAHGPNMILVAVDTLRADYLRLHNPEAQAATPNLDAFAQEALLFEVGAAQASWTKPSFGTIFTGLYPEMHTATGKTSRLPDSVETLAELLQAGGYWTQGFANNPNVSPIFGFDQGFSEYAYLKPRTYFWATDSALKLSMYEVLRKVRMRVKDKLSAKVGFLFKMNVQDYYQPGEVVTQEALAWLDENAPAARPFYLYLHYMDPHDPFMDPDAKSGGYARANMPDPDPDKFTEPMRQAYVKEIERLDAALGDLIGGLKARGTFDDALIVFTADHGEEFQDHGGWWHGFTLYEEMTHVPLIIKLPKGKHAGTRSLDLARHIDLAPTFLHFAGLAKGKAMPGQSLFDANGLLTNQSITFSYAENNFEGNVLRSIRDYRSKVITANEDNVSGLAPVEVYDLYDDPGERKNLGTQEMWVPALMDELARFEKLVKEGAAAAESSVVTGSDREQLNSLGYF